MIRELSASPFPTRAQLQQRSKKVSHDALKKRSTVSKALTEWISRASENFGSLSIELKDFADGKKVRDDVESAIDQIADFPPGDAEEVDIVRFESINEVMSLVITSDLSESHLRQGAELIEEALLALPSVSLVDMLGKRDYEISIEVSEASLRRYGLTIDQVATAVRLSSLNLSSGELRTEAGDLLLRTNTKRNSGTEFADIVLRARADGTVLRLGDVANIRDGFVDQDFINEFKGQAAIFLSVKASVSEDILELAGEIKGLLADYQPLDGVSVQIWNDRSEFLADRLSLLVRNGVLGFSLVFLFLVVMLDLRLAIWVAMGVPISFLGAFMFFDYFDVNINMVSLFALIIVLGIVVDDAIVVGENIISEQELGYTGQVAAMLGVNGVISPVLIGVLTTMAAFAPLLFVTGTFGQILSAVPVVVITVLAMSLIEAFFILPAHLAHGSNWSRWPLDACQKKVSRGLTNLRDNTIIPMIRIALRFRYRTLIFALLFLVASASLLVSGAVRFIFFPFIESDRLRADIAFPIGTPFEITRSAAEHMVGAAHAVNADMNDTAFESVSVTIGGQTSTAGGPAGGSRISVAGHLASVQIQLHDEPLRTNSGQELERLWREKVGAIPGTESISYSAQSFGGGPDLEYELTHQDDTTLEAAVESLRAAYENLPGVFDIQDSLSPGKRQYDIELTSAGEAIGLTPSAGRPTAAPLLLWTGSPTDTTRT